MKNNLDNLLTPLILAGGRGSRLKSKTKKIPKPLLKVNDKYFIKYIFDKLLSVGFQEVFVSISYLKDTFMNYIGDNYKGLSINYLIEEEPLGTGGSVKNAFKKLNVKNLMIFNGDSYSDFNLKLLINNFKSNSRNTILLCKIQNSCRFGSVIFDNNLKIKKFVEKKHLSRGYVNAGIYMLDNSILKIEKNEFSIEKDYFEKCQVFDFYGYLFEGDFIDIGTLESLLHAQSYFKGI